MSAPLRGAVTSSGNMYVCNLVSTLLSYNVFDSKQVIGPIGRSPSKDRSFLTSSEVVVDGDDGESRKRIEYVKEGQ